MSRIFDQNLFSFVLMQANDDRKNRHFLIEHLLCHKLNKGSNYSMLCNLYPLTSPTSSLVSLFVETDGLVANSLTNAFLDHPRSITILRQKIWGWEDAHLFARVWLHYYKDVRNAPIWFFESQSCPLDLSCRIVTLFIERFGVHKRPPVHQILPVPPSADHRLP